MALAFEPAPGVAPGAEVEVPRRRSFAETLEEYLARQETEKRKAKKAQAKEERDEAHKVFLEAKTAFATAKQSYRDLKVVLRETAQKALGKLSDYRAKKQEATAARKVYS